jgi:hypothetical protein
MDNAYRDKKEVVSVFCAFCAVQDVQLWLTNLSQNRKERKVVVVEIHAVVMVVETAVVEKTVVETEEDNILFYNYKKKGQFKLSLFG